MASKAKVRGKFPAELINWVTSDEGEITEKVNEAISHVLTDRKKRSQVFLTALARKYIERIVFIMEQLPVIEKALFHKDRVGSMRTSDLIRVMGMMGSQLFESSDFLRSFVTEDEMRTEVVTTTQKVKDVSVEDITDDERKAVDEIPAESRQKLSRILKRLVQGLEVEKSKEKKLLVDSNKKGDINSTEN
jgi:hypothetical protein